MDTTRARNVARQHWEAMQALNEAAAWLEDADAYGLRCHHDAALRAFNAAKRTVERLQPMLQAAINVLASAKLREAQLRHAVREVAAEAERQGIEDPVAFAQAEVKRAMGRDRVREGRHFRIGSEAHDVMHNVSKELSSFSFEPRRSLKQRWR